MCARAPFFLLLLSLALSPICASLMAVDLGLGYIKVAVARPGRGLELVTNEQAKRKTPAAVGFTLDNERLFGDAAVAFAAKAPHRAILDGRTLIGECLDPLNLGPLCERKKISLEGVGDFTGEEVVAMLLAMARRQASAFLGGSTIKDVAVTVPAWYDDRQRQAIVDAAKVIGLNCLGVVNANTAAALKYALDGKAKPTAEMVEKAKNADKKKKTPKTVTQTVMFYDLGAGSASASIAQLTADVKTGIASKVKMLAHAWEKGIGGKMLDEVVVQRLADAFDKQRGDDATPSRDIPRVMQRLKKEAQKVREVLSANTDTFVSVASLYDDMDLKTTLSRADFESDAASMFSLVGRPVKQALNEAKIEAKDLDAIVPFGGVSRTPKVQENLCEALGIATLNKSINTDEAAVMGSVFFAASLSNSFRVRKMDFEDVYSRSVVAEIEKESSSGGLFSGKEKKKATQKVEIFPAGSGKMPSKKTLSLNRKKDFGLELYLGLDDAGKTRYPERTLYAKIQVKGISDVLKKLKDKSKAKSLTPRVALTFHVDRSGYISIGTAESSVDETVVVEREVEIKEEKEKKAEDTTDDKKDPEASAEGEEPKDDAEDTKPTNEEEKSETSEKDEKKSKDSKKKKKTKIEKSTQTVVHRHPLTIEYTDSEGLMGMQMSGTQLQAAKQVLKDLEKADNERVERADALNSLEGFILEIRSQVRGLDEDDDLYKVSTEEERDNLIQAFDDGEDWMYTDEAKQTANLRKKHFELKKLFEPMENRAKELSKRPSAFKDLNMAVELALEKSIELRQIHEERNSTKLEFFDKFREFCSTMKIWIAEKQEEQANQDLSKDPVVTIKDILEKGKSLREEVEKIAKLEIPPALKISPPPSEEKDEAVGEKVETSGQAENVNTTSPEEPQIEDENAGRDGPPEPDADGAKVGAASGAAGGKDEL